MDNSKNIFHNIDFNTLKASFQEVLKSAIEKYWQIDTNIILEAVNDFRQLRQEILTVNTDFFSSQIKVENHSPIVIRLSKKFAGTILSTVLEDDSQNRRFKLSTLTKLETKLLNNFSEFLYKKIDTILRPSKEVKFTDDSLKNINFLFLIQIKNKGSSRIMLSIPTDRLILNELVKEESFSDEDFITSNTLVKIKAGSSKITLDELKNLSKDDIILLENSKSTSLKLISGDLTLDFNVKADPSIILNIDDEDEIEENIRIEENEVTMSKNLWDDIQIEISAEFDKVKMTIGELKQITKGQVVDLGSVFNHQISLYVENKKIAKGELVIINDRYAVKLNEILSAKPTITARKEKEQEQQQQTTQAPEQQPQTETEQPQSEAKDEDFDYSDFEK